MISVGSTKEKMKTVLDRQCGFLFTVNVILLGARAGTDNSTPHLGGGLQVLPLFLVKPSNRSTWDNHCEHFDGFFQTFVRYFLHSWNIIYVIIYCIFKLNIAHIFYVLKISAKYFIIWMYHLIILMLAIWFPVFTYYM